MSHRPTHQPQHASRPGRASSALRVAVAVSGEGRAGHARAHAVEVARHLAEVGHDVTLLLWAHQGSTVIEAERWGVAVNVLSTLRRRSPVSWVRAGRRLRGVDAIVVMPSSPTEVVAHLQVLRAAGAVTVAGNPGRRSGLPGSGESTPRSVVVDLLEPRAVYGAPATALITGCDAVVVHDQAHAVVARRLGASHVSLIELPPTATALTRQGPNESHASPLDPPRSSHAASAAGSTHRAHRAVGSKPVRLLLVRPYATAHEADRLVRAVRAVPGISLTIAVGPGGVDSSLTSLVAADPDLARRVDVSETRLNETRLVALLRDHDVLVVPPIAAGTDLERAPEVGGGAERAGGSEGGDVALAHAHGLAALATAQAPFSTQVTDGVDGLLVARDSDTALTTALRRLCDPAVRLRLGVGAREPEISAEWAHYLGALEALAAQPPMPQFPPTTHDRLDGSTSAPTSLARLTGGVGQSMRGAATWAQPARLMAVRASTLATRASRRAGAGAAAPTDPGAALCDVSLTDVLVVDEPGAARVVQRLATRLGLPSTRDQPGAWAALGALAAIVRVCDDGTRRAVLVDESGPRSVFSRWARSAGFAPVHLGFTGMRPRVKALDVDAGSLDAVVRIHPRGCDAADIDQVLEQAAWALRPRGLFVVTVPIGPPGARGALAPADVRGVVARARDLGFVLVGEIDGALTTRMRRAAAGARVGDAPYGLVRLTLRRR